MSSRHYNTIFSRTHNSLLLFNLNMLHSLFFATLLSLLFSHSHTYSMEVANQNECQIMCQAMLGGMAIIAATSTGYITKKINDYFKNQTRLKIESRQQRYAFIQQIEESEYILNPTNIVKQGPAFLKQLAKELPANILEHVQIPTDIEDYMDALESASEDINLLIFRNTPENRPFLKERNLYIFYGPPSVGKTTTALAIAHTLNRPILFLKGSNIADTYQNSGAQNITVLLNSLLDSPHDWLIIIDEIDSLIIGSNNKDIANSQESKTATALWLALDGLLKHKNILVIGTCNNPELLPSALKERTQRRFIAFRELSPQNKVNLFFKYLIKEAPCPIVNDCHSEIFKLIVQVRLYPRSNRIIKDMIIAFPGYIKFKKYQNISPGVILDFLNHCETGIIPDKKIDSESERLHKESMALSRELAQQSQEHAQRLHEDNKTFQLHLQQENRADQERHATDALNQARNLHLESLTHSATQAEQQSRISAEQFRVNLEQSANQHRENAARAELQASYMTGSFGLNCGWINGSISGTFDPNTIRNQFRETHR